jgi:hypothetical protein
MRIATGLVDPIIATRSGTVVDEHGRRHEISAGTTRWDRSSPELRDPLIAAHFGLSRAAPAPFPNWGITAAGSRPSWYLD